MKRTVAAAAAAMWLAPIVASAGTTIDYEDLAEAFYGTSFSHQGVTYQDVNQVSGVFPDGSTFGPQVDEQVIIEDATLLYDAFPGWGSADKTLTFGSSFIAGDNVSLGRVSSVTMLLDTPANSVSMDIAFYENGPWGGIELHLDALNGGSVVGQDSLTISDLGGRDNVVTDSFAVNGVQFDELHVYATFGSDYSLPRLLIDDLTLNSVPEPGSIALLGLGLLVMRRRR
jgi:hypothetical protein